MTRKLLAIIGVYLVIIVIFSLFRPTPIDWTETYLSEDKIPYGSYILYHELADVLQADTVVTSERPAHNALGDTSVQGALYFSVSQHFFADELDVSTLLDFIARGNTAFLSTHEFSPHLLDTLGLTTTVEFHFNKNPSEWMYHPNLQVDLLEYPEKNWRLAVRYEYTTIGSDQSRANTTVLGFARDDANYLRYMFGKGTLYLHTTPQAFSNYCLADTITEGYGEAVLSHLPPTQHVIWDGYYKGTASRQANPLYVLARHPSFQWAYWITVIGSIMFVVFTAKRRQRVIPVISPPRNTSLDFVRTIGDLYFETANHTDLAKKKVRYFRMHVKSNYRLDLSGFTEDEIQRLAIRSGKDTEQIRQLFTDLQQVNESDSVSVSQLGKIQDALDVFYDRSS